MPDFNLPLENIPSEDLIPLWHNSLNCKGTLSGPNPWECTEDLNCPMMQQIVRIAKEGEN